MKYFPLPLRLMLRRYLTVRPFCRHYITESGCVANLTQCYQCKRHRQVIYYLYEIS